MRRGCLQVSLRGKLGLWEVSKPHSFILEVLVWIFCLYCIREKVSQDYTKKLFFYDNLRRNGTKDCDYVRVQQPNFLAVCLCQTSLCSYRLYLLSEGGEWCWWVLPYIGKGPSTGRLSARTHARKSLQVGTDLLTLGTSGQKGEMKKKVLTFNWLTTAANGSYTRLEQLFWKLSRANNDTTAVVWFVGSMVWGHKRKWCVNDKPKVSDS